MQDKNNNYSKLTLFILSLILVSACGSGGESVVAGSDITQDSINDSDDELSSEAKQSNSATPDLQAAFPTIDAVGSGVSVGEAASTVSNQASHESQFYELPVSESGQINSALEEEPNTTSSESVNFAPFVSNSIDSNSIDSNSIDSQIDESTDTPVTETGPINPVGDKEPVTTPPQSSSLIPFTPNIIGSEVGDVVKILENLPVSKAQLTTQQTSINTRDGYVYTANIEPGPNGD
nr:hypothetical protein [Granulosicoccus sp.]